MTNRRTFIKSLATIPSVLSCEHSWAANDPSRLALIIGNSAYPGAPLDNPVNDARAVSSLFTQAGFTVDARLNAGRDDMMAAIELFGTAVRRAETKLVVFYYAGHGAQLDWRNYLLPVDAVVQTQEHMKQRCVDLSLLLGQLQGTKDKTFIFILDACRNNPFGTSYRPEQKGLSQFDAPAGSLLAYATSPGNVASDGSGTNGLYTENLVRELSKPGTRIEDALKRVRLNVRLASNGAQIPWETTSLESDVFIFDDGQKKLSDSERERLLEAEFLEWTRIKSSHQVADFVSYLKNYPNGRFAEIAQARMTRLLAEPDPSLTGDAALSARPLQAIELRPGGPVPQLLQLSANPYSVGRYPLGRQFSVGDEAVIRVSDTLSNARTGMLTLRVTQVDMEADRVELNNGEWVMDLMGNFIQTPVTGPQDLPQQTFPTELQLGKKWKSAWKQQDTRFGLRIYTLEMSVVAFEKLRIEAGEFNVFRIEGHGWTNVGTKVDRQYWVVPGINFALRYEYRSYRSGRFWEADRYELVSLRQQTIDTRCAARSSPEARSLTIKSSCS